jgi:transketolase
LITDKKIWLLTGDLGFGVLNEVRQQVPDRTRNMGAAEQLMLGAAVGLSHNGYIVLCYSISPFVIFRPYELLRNYLNHELAPVKLIGIGRGQDYGHLGQSHWAEDDVSALNVFPNIVQFRPNTEQDLVDIWTDFVYNNKPSYINICRQ